MGTEILHLSKTQLCQFLLSEPYTFNCVRNFPNMSQRKNPNQAKSQQTKLKISRFNTIPALSGSPEWKPGSQDLADTGTGPSKWRPETRTWDLQTVQILNLVRVDPGLTNVTGPWPTYFTCLVSIFNL